MQQLKTDHKMKLVFIETGYLCWYSCMFSVWNKETQILKLLWFSFCCGQGCQVFTTKPFQLWLRTSLIVFWGGPRSGGKIHVLLAGFPWYNSHSQAKYDIIGIASTLRTWKIPAANSVKVAQFRENRGLGNPAVAHKEDILQNDPKYGKINIQI